MTGWFILILLLAGSAAAFWLSGLRGAMLQLAGAALLIGAAGYSLQGRPGLAGSTRAASEQAGGIPLTGIRRAFFGQFNRTEHWLIMSESMARRGDTGKAVAVLRSGVREHPNDPALWVGLGNALVEHGRTLTPPAELAFRRAAELAPGHPAPAFFLGLAHARSGDRQAALAVWRALLADAPAEASWRPLVEDATAALGGAPPRP